MNVITDIKNKEGNYRLRRLKRNIATAMYGKQTVNKMYCMIISLQKVKETEDMSNDAMN